MEDYSWSVYSVSKLHLPCTNDSWVQEQWRHLHTMWHSTQLTNILNDPFLTCALFEQCKGHTFPAHRHSKRTIKFLSTAVYSVVCNGANTEWVHKIMSSRRDTHPHCKKRSSAGCVPCIRWWRQRARMMYHFRSRSSPCGPGRIKWIVIFCLTRSCIGRGKTLKSCHAG